MRNTAELPADLLDGRLASSEPEDASSATRIAHVAQLADRGDHPAAAREAAGLIEAGIHDIRLIGFYLFGVFLDRGIGYLPALLGRVTALIADDLAALRPGRRKLQVVNSATAWLFEHVSAQLVFHARQRSATWESWSGEADTALPDAIAAGCTKLTLALEAVIDAPLAAVPLARVRRWALEDLRRALARREAAERAPAVTSTAVAVASAPAHEPEQLAAPSDDPDELPPDEPADLEAELAGPAMAPRARLGPGADTGPDRGGADDPVAVGSPALAVLQAKLAGFQALIARGDLARAAVVASDIRAVLAGFDPVAYFPSMFAAYFKTLHQVIDELAPYLERADQPSWHALDSYYRADLRAFIDD
ncbi:MAG TPA: type VI secretion system protein IglI family protein [Kofleriaceae bacterium]|jgi:hypothetical protein|nr:type VI secretion system protein IglI family protein [Kofleriaceae bacterium]